MILSMELFEMFAVNVGIYLRRGNRAVAKHFLHKSYVGAVGQQMGCKGMA
jgi:hypothetical protein